MDRHTKYQGKILKFLPKAASVMNLPFSPNKDKRYSGAIVPMMIPHEARIRRKSKDDDDSINNREPTSPKISCMGQIKLKNKTKAKRGKITRDHHAHDRQASSSSGIKKMFSFKNNKEKPAGGRKSSASASSTHSGGDQSLCDRSAPALSQMRRFASGRDQRMASFDWTATQVAPVDAEYRNEAGDHGDVIIPFSAPLGNNEIDMPLQPRKEINLWKRRTMTPPRPLELNTMMITAN